MKWTGIFLLPVTFLYSLVVRLRNHLYNIGYSRNFNFDVPVILAGNLSAGGSGKTPMVEYLVRLLKDKYKLAVLSRGYKRETRGFHLASGRENYKTIGDEPMQYFRKWNKEIAVAVCEDRVEAIPKILYERPQTQVILMDDGYQHRAISPDLKILLTDYSQPFFKDFLLPTGRLREPRKEACRADVILATRCPEGITPGEQELFRSEVRKYTRIDVPVFFTRLCYGEPRPLFDRVLKREFSEVLVFSGIAKPLHFEQYISSKWDIVKTRRYPDHHAYTSSDLRKLKDLWAAHSTDETVILTTEKDSVKLADPEIERFFQDLPIFMIPVEMEFFENGLEFDDTIYQAIKAKTGF